MRWVDGAALHDQPEPGPWADAGAQVRIAHDLGGGPPFGTGFGGFEPEQPTWRAFFEAFAERMLRDCEQDLDFPADQAARIRAAVRAAAPLLDAPHLAWCHGDLQPDHVLVDPTTNRVAAIIDWADQGSGDVGWDVAVLTVDHDRYLDVFLAGYGAGRRLARRARSAASALRRRASRRRGNVARRAQLPVGRQPPPRDFLAAPRRVAFAA